MERDEEFFKQESAKLELARLIVEEIKNEFKMIHFSLNLFNTLTIYRNDENNWCVEIPAEMYDFKIFKQTGAIVPWGNGSYASRIDETGGFFRKHKNYVNKCINRAIIRWMRSYNIEGRVID